MKTKDRAWNSALMVLTICGIGACLIIWPFRAWLAVAAQQIKAEKNWLPALMGIGYGIGFFVTRVVEDSFDAIFGKPPFSDIGEVAEKGPKHPRWVDSMLGPLGYLLFFVRVALIIAALVVLLRLGLWLATLRGGPAPQA